MSAARGPQTEDDIKEQEKRRQEQDKFNNDFATYWAILNDYPELYRVETGETVSGDKTTENSGKPTITTADPRAKCIEDGRYRHHQFDDLEVIVKNGKASAVGIVLEADIERSTVLLLTTMGYGKGNSALILDWDNTEYLTVAKLDYALNAFEGTKDRPAVRPIFGSKVEEWLSKLTTEQRDHFYKRRREIEAKQQLQEPLYAMSKSTSLRNATDEMNAHTKLKANASDQDKKNYVEDMLTSEDPKTKIKTKLQDEAKLDKIIEQVNSVSQRAESVAKTQKELEGFVSSTEETCKSLEQDINNVIDVNQVKKIHKECISSCAQAKDAIVNEVPDIAIKEKLWLAELNKSKAELTTQLTAEKAKLEQAKQANTDIKPIEANIKKLNEQMDKIKKAEQKIEAANVSQTLDNAKKDFVRDPNKKDELTKFEERLESLKDTIDTANDKKQESIAKAQAQSSAPKIG